MLHEEAFPQLLRLLCTYDPRDRWEKPAFLYLFVSCPPISTCISPLVFAVWASLLRLSEFPLKPQSSEGVLRQGLFGPLLGQFESVWVFSDTKATLSGGVPWLSVCSVWSPRYGAKVGGQEGAEGFIPKSIFLGHKSDMSHREKKGNTYATSIHLPCFLQNWSNSKTVL